MPVVASLVNSTSLPSMVTVKPEETHVAKLQVPETSTVSSTGPVSICSVACPSCVMTTYACWPLANLYSTFTLVGTVSVEDALDSESLLLLPLLLLMQVQTYLPSL